MHRPPLLPILLLGAALPATLAHDKPSPTPSPKTSFRLPLCVTNCLASSGCPDATSASCICRPSLLSDATTCLFYFCPDALRSFDTQFLDKIDDGCASAGRAIPAREIDKLERTARGLVSKLPKATTSTSTREVTTSSSAVRTTVEATTTPPAVVPVPEPRPATTFVQSASGTEGAPRGDPTDSSPFATVRKGEAVGVLRAAGWTVALPLVAAMVL